MKIGFVVDDGIDSNDGVQQYVKTLGSWLLSRGNEVVYITSTGSVSNVRTHNVARNMRVRFNKNVLRVPFGASIKELSAILEKEKFNVVHIQMPYSPLLSGRLIHVLPANVALVGTFHIAPFGAMHSRFSKLLAYLLKPQIGRFQTVMSVSPAAQEFASAVFGIKSMVVPNAVNVDLYKNNTKKVANRMIFVGRLVHRKGCLRLLAAISHLVNVLKYSDFELIIIGDGPEKNAMSSYITAHNIETNVRLLGKVPEKAKREYLAASSVAVYPAISGESFGIVLIEAMAAGCLVLGGNNPGYSYVLDKCPAALFNPYDHDQLSQLLMNCLTNQKIAHKIKNQQKIILNQFSIDSVGKSVYKCYEDAIEKLHSKEDNNT